MKDFAYYRDSKTPYPDVKDFTTTYYYQRGVLVAVQSGDGVEFKTPGYSIDDLEDLLKEVVRDDQGFAAARDAYWAEQAKLEAEFVADLYEELGIADNPKAHMLYTKAYERGHSNGHYEVYQVACDLVDLIR